MAKWQLLLLHLPGVSIYQLYNGNFIIKMPDDCFWEWLFRKFLKIKSSKLKEFYSIIRIPWLFIRWLIRWLVLIRKAPAGMVKQSLSTLQPIVLIETGMNLVKDTEKSRMQCNPYINPHINPSSSFPGIEISESIEHLSSTRPYIFHRNDGLSRSFCIILQFLTPTESAISNIMRSTCCRRQRQLERRQRRWVGRRVQFGWSDVR